MKHYDVLEKSQISKYLVESLTNNRYCSYVIKHTPFPLEPDCGFNTAPALDAVTT